MLFLIGLDINIFWCKLALLNISVQVTPAQHQIGLQRLLLLSSAVAGHYTGRGETVLYVHVSVYLSAYLCIHAYLCTCGYACETMCLGVSAYVYSSAVWPTFGSQFTLHVVQEKHIIWMRWILTILQTETRSCGCTWSQIFVPSRLDAPYPFTSLEKSSVKQCHVLILAALSIPESKQKPRQLPQTPLYYLAKLHCCWLNYETWALKNHIC